MSENLEDSTSEVIDEADNPNQSSENNADEIAMEESNIEDTANVEDRPNDESFSNLVESNDLNLETLLKVPVSVAIEVGRTKMILSDLLETQEGTVIELERLLDEPLDILVNGALIAHGVVVLANEKFGIQITDIISPQARARSL